MNDIALQRIQENKKTKTPKLNLSGLGLSAIPPEIKDMVWLEELNLSQNKIKTIEHLEKFINLKNLSIYINQIEKLEGLDELKNLQQLRISNNKITKIEGLEELKNLQKLYLIGNQIAKIEGLDGLQNLQALNVSNNQITKLEGLEELKNLQKLYLIGNQIAKIEGLDGLQNLQALNVSNNQITKLEGLEELKNLQELYLSSNQIAKIEGLDGLQNLQVLNVSDNHLTKLESLDKLTNLKELDVSYNQIHDIKGVCKLNDMEKLNVSRNKITNIDTLQHLPNLKKIDISYNPLSDIKILEQNKHLHYIALSGTQIQSIKPLYQFLNKRAIGIKLSNDFLSWTAEINSLYLNNCKNLIEPPPEWLQLGTDAVVEYFDALEEQGGEQLNEAKLMLVGRPHAGKTTLSGKLRDNDADMPTADKSTRGIDIEDWEYTFNNKKYIAHIWDFGGQNIQYAMHQFYMSQRAIYVLVDCTRDPEQNSQFTVLGETKSDIVSNYWLQTIQNLANGAPALYVCNLYDSYSNDALTYNNLQRQYNFLDKQMFELNLSQVSADNKSTIEQLRLKLQQKIEELPNVGVILPKKWMRVRERLLELEQENSYIRLDMYYSICHECGIKDEKAADVVSSYLHEIGAIIRYAGDKTNPLYKLIILNRKWATEATYLVLLDKAIQRGGGCFGTADLERIWSGSAYDKMSAELLALLLKFELCFELKHCKTPTYLIPQCLPVQYPPEVDSHLREPVCLQYNYTFLPYGIVNRLTVRLHNDIDGKGAWKNGAILKENNGRLVVEELKNNNTGIIKLTLSGDKQDRDYLRKRAMHELDDINSIYNLSDKVKVEVPCICADCKSSTGPYMHEYNKLLRKLSKGRYKEECDKSLEEVEILELIDHAFFERPKEVEQGLMENEEKYKNLHIDKVEKLYYGDKPEIHEQKYETGGGDIKIGSNHKTEVRIENKVDEKQGATGDKPQKPPFLEPRHKRHLIAGWSIAFALLLIFGFILSWKIAMIIFVGIGSFFTYRALTKINIYMRLARAVFFSGAGVVAALNAIPFLNIEAWGNITFLNNIINFAIKYAIDARPVVTISIIAGTFMLSGFLAFLSFLSYKSERGKV